MIFPWEAETQVPWIETREAKLWARTTFQLEPPPLHSPERNRVLQAIREDQDLIDGLCIQSFWNNHDDESVLLSRIRSLKIRIAQNTALIAPWRLLPTELQALIFEYIDHTRSSEITHTPIGHVVSQVCRRWREVALLTPKCWTDICIYDSKLAPPLLERWLERSKTLPLNIVLVETSYKQVHKMRLLLWHVNRIECLVFTPRPRFYYILQVLEFEDTETTPAPVLPKLLDGATRLKHLVLPHGLLRGSRFRNLQINLPALETVSGIESSEVVRNLKSGASLKCIAVHDPETKCDFLPLLAQCSRVAPGLETLDLTNWSLMLTENNLAVTQHSLPALKRLFLPKHPKALHTLDRQVEMFPSLTIISLQTAEATNGPTSIPQLPTVTVLCFRQIKLTKPSEPNPYQPWLQKCPKLQILILEATMWVHSGLAPNLLQNLYHNEYVNEFSWNNLDQARLYAWPHTWCISIAKKRELRLYEHALADIRPTCWINEHMFPYTITLCWLEFEEKIKAITTHVKDTIEEGSDSELW